MFNTLYFANLPVGQVNTKTNLSEAISAGLGQALISNPVLLPCKFTWCVISYEMSAGKKPVMDMQFKIERFFLIKNHKKFRFWPELLRQFRFIPVLSKIYISNFDNQSVIMINSSLTQHGRSYDQSFDLNNHI